jgi:asparagine synthase (glutamine-hydrolysing)
MSGVFGVAAPEKVAEICRLTTKMASAMTHRAWYVTESFVNPAQNLAIGRIGIGIFNQFAQPIWNASSTVALVMAGELYQRDSDATNVTGESDEQFILSLYDRFSDDFIHHLNGAFIIALYDKRLQRLLLANDRYGLYPLFYAYRSGRLLFAPEMKGILCDETFPRKVDLTALAQYVRFQHLLGARTFFEDIQLLPSASLLQYDLTTGIYNVKPYWSFADIPYRSEITLQEAAEEVGMLLQHAVRRLSGDKYKPGVYLSGGLDSRTILGMTERRPIVSLTFGTHNCRDVQYARRIATVIGSDHHWFDLHNGTWVKEQVDFHLELTEGFHSWIHAHGISTLPQARQWIDVNLTGWDGGTIMGHPDSVEPLQIFAVDDLALITRLFHQFTHKYTWPSITEPEERLLYCEPLLGKIQGLAFDSFRDEITPYLGYRPDVRGDYFYIHHHCRRLTQNLVTFKRSHIEARFPFFDYELFEFLYSLPAQLRQSRTLYRTVIQQRIPQLAYIPYDHDGYLPTTNPLIRGSHMMVVKLKHRINRHVKTIFPVYGMLYADYEDYLRTDLRDWAEGILFDKRTIDRGIFAPSYLRTLMDRHLSKLEEWTIGKIAPLITYEMMLRRFYD